MNMQEEINRLDLAYQKLTNRAFRTGGIVTGREQGWVAFINAGFTVADLETVVLWIKGKILAGIYHEPRLAWRRLIADLQNFEDELATAKAEKRNAKPQPTPRDRVLSQARPTVVESVSADVTAKPIGDYIAKLRASVEQV